MSSHSSAPPPRRPQQAADIARIYEDFRRGERRAVDDVGAWIGAIVHRGNWRFADAEGVAQEILVRLFETVRAGKVQDPESFKKFTFSVAKHLCTRTYYRERRRPDRTGADVEDESVTVADDTSPQGDLLEKEKLDATLYAFQRLSSSCRKLWALLYGDGLSAPEAADRLGLTANNVRVKAHRCLARAKELTRSYV
jgi:RNA polymerase sigma factor (sigma-70 family)